MKKALYLLITLAILGGCSNAPAANNTENTANTKTNNSTNATAGVSPVDGSTVPANTAESAPEGVSEVKPIVQPDLEIKLTEDQKIRGEAVSKLDLAICNKLSDANSKQGCQLEIISQKVMTDPEYCKTLTDPEHQNICKGVSLTILPPKS